MATVYEQVLQQLGTNEITTSPAFKAAMEANEEAIKQEQFNEAANNLVSLFWHAAVIILGALAVYFLWRIYRQNQKKSSPNQQSSWIQADQQNKDRQHADNSPPISKPPLLDSRAQKCQNLPLSKVQSAHVDSLTSNPDHRYMPKN